MSALQQASLLVNASPQRLREVLLDPLSMPEWNPAFKSVTGPSRVTLDEVYRLTIRTGLTGRLAYPVIGPDLIRMVWQVPGFTETGAWHLRQQRERTLVQHDFIHAGPLAAALSRAYRGVAELRVERLEQRLIS